MQSLFDQPFVFSLFQMVLDVSLIVFLTVFLVKRSRSAKAIETLTASLDKIIGETKSISEQFDANLRERQELIQQFIFKLDQHLRDAERMCQRLESLQREAKPAAQPAHHSLHSTALPAEHQDIFSLAQKGLDAESIAKRLQKPVGEVELILKLRKMSAQ